MQCNLSIVNCHDHAVQRKINKLPWPCSATYVKINCHGHAVQLKLNKLAWPCSAT